MCSQFTTQRKYISMRPLKYLLIAAVLFSACDKIISEFQHQNFVKLFGGGSGTFGFDVTEVDDGGYLATGYTVTTQLRRQVYVASVNKAGNSIWQRSFGTEHNEEGRVVKFYDNEIFVAGTNTNFITGNVQTFVLRLSLQGDSLAYNLLNVANNMVVNDMLVSEGNIYLVGERYSDNSTLANYFIACTDFNGSLVWSREYGNNQGRQTFFRIFGKDNGNFLLVGSTNAIIGSTVNRISIVELNSQGISVSASYFDATTDQIFGDAFFDGNGVYAFFSTTEGPTTKSHICFFSSNSIAWIQSDGFNGLASGLELINENTLLLACDNSSGVTFYRVNISSNGVESINELKTYSGSVKSILTTKDKGVVCVGTTAPDYGSMLRLIKTDKDLYLLNL